MYQYDQLDQVFLRQRVAQFLEGLDHRAGREREICERFLPPLQRGQEIDQHDLPA